MDARSLQSVRRNPVSPVRRRRSPPAGRAPSTRSRCAGAAAPRSSAPGPSRYSRARPCGRYPRAVSARRRGSRLLFGAPRRALTSRRARPSRLTASNSRMSTRRFAARCPPSVPARPARARGTGGRRRVPIAARVGQRSRVSLRRRLGRHGQAGLHAALEAVFSRLVDTIRERALAAALEAHARVAAVGVVEPAWGTSGVGGRTGRGRRWSPWRCSSTAAGDLSACAFLGFDHGGRSTSSGLSSDPLRSQPRAWVGFPPGSSPGGLYYGRCVILPGATGRASLTWWFFFFLGSGFAGLVYEVVWLRLAMAAFGVTTPLVSIVLSVFMAGAALRTRVLGPPRPP